VIVGINVLFDGNDLISCPDERPSTLLQSRHVILTSEALFFTKLWNRDDNKLETAASKAVYSKEFQRMASSEVAQSFRECDTSGDG
jgi:hypothetical protein